MEKTLAQEALELLSSVPAEDFIVDKFTDGNGKCCAIGHYLRLKGNNPYDYNYENCNDDYTDDCTNKKRSFRNLTRKFIKEKHDTYDDVASVNNDPFINGYTEPVVKDRVIHLLKDMVEAGY